MSRFRCGSAALRYPSTRFQKRHGGIEAFPESVHEARFGTSPAATEVERPTLRLLHAALAWVLRDNRITSELIGASRTEQIKQNVSAIANLTFSAEELQKIDEILVRHAA